MLCAKFSRCVLCTEVNRGGGHCWAVCSLWYSISAEQQSITTAAARLFKFYCHSLAASSLIAFAICPLCSMCAGRLVSEYVDPLTSLSNLFHFIRPEYDSWMVLVETFSSDSAYGIFFFYLSEDLI